VTPHQPAHGYVTVTVQPLESRPAGQPARGLLLVGERHNDPGKTSAAFSGDGSSRRRLEQLIGGPLFELASTMNLSDGEVPWNPAAARSIADTVCRSWDGWVVACGRLAARAFGLDDFLTWHGRVGAIPHPSGRCRYWNDPAYVDATRLFLHPALTEVRSSSLAVSGYAAG
jgi:hypothetical protein